MLLADAGTVGGVKTEIPVEFPAQTYRHLFEQETGLEYSSYERLLGHYERLEGLPFDLNYLRGVRAEKAISLREVQTHGNDLVLRLPEQERKRKLIVTRSLRTYGDFAAPANQPIRLASFRPRGVYSSDHPVKFNFSFLARLTRIAIRKVYEPRLGAEFDEVELDFHRGMNWKLAVRWPFIKDRTRAPAGRGRNQFRRAAGTAVGPAVRFRSGARDVRDRDARGLCAAPV